MASKIIVHIKGYFSKGHERSRLTKKNIALSFLLKGGSIVTMLLLIPVSIAYISPAQYGVWLTLSSIVSWLSFFDVGLGNGLKNKLAADIARHDTQDSKIYVSTTYVLLALIAILFFIILAFANHFVNWNSVLNAGAEVTGLNSIVLMVCGFFCVQFVLQILNSILTACQAIAKVSLILLVSQVFTLAAVFCLVRLAHPSLLLLVLINAGTPVLILCLASLWYYHRELNVFSPSLGSVDFKHARHLLGLGGAFFVIQIGALVLFQTDNIVITQLFGPEQVTVFNVAYKLFSVLILSFNIIVTPFWSAFTDAYAQNDFVWIKRMMKKMQVLWIGISTGGLVLFFIAPLVYRLWLHDTIKVPVSLSLAMAVYIAAYAWQTIHVYFLNGINKIRLQLYLVIASSLVNIPLAIILGKKIGLAGVTLANAAVFIVMGILFSYQTSKIINQKATGIWSA